MNLLLFRQDEIENHQVILRDRRAAHLKEVLQVQPGSRLRGGIINLGKAALEVVAVSTDSLTLRVADIEQAPRPKVRVVLCLPRPKVLSRCLALIASFGVQQISLINAWRVEKSYFSSPRLSPARLHDDLILGCEQGGQVWLPEIKVEPLFQPFLDEREPELHRSAPGPRLLLEPNSGQDMHEALVGASPNSTVTLAIGPEGGFIEPELNSLSRAGFRAVELCTGTLKTDVAISAALGQLALCRNRHLRLP